MAPQQTSLDALNARLQAVLSRLAALELAAGVTPAEALAHRQQLVLQRLARLEAACGLASTSTAAPAAAAPATAAAAVGTLAAGLHEVTAVDSSGSDVQQRLRKELLERGITRHKFVRAPPEYYDRPLEFRQGVVGAASVHHLCKSIVMVNTRAPPHIVDCSDPNNSKYYLIVVQYTARLNAEKLKNFIHSLSGGKVSKRFYNMRLAPQEVSDELTGFEHNGVSPIAVRTRMPIILSHRIAELQPDVFFLGAGEVDLKVGFSAADFIKAYKPMVVDCTFNEGDSDDTASEASSAS
ncbi:hypothetical protein ABPG77_010089 [Micractinium sp. CCAP 211/92]